MQQAYHLAKQFDCQVALIIFDKEDIVSQYSSDCMKTILTKCLKKEYRSKRQFTNHNIEMAMGEPKPEPSNETDPSFRETQTVCGKPLLSADVLRKSESTSSLPSTSTPEDTKTIEQQKQQHVEALDLLNKQLNSLKINDVWTDKMRLDSMVYKIACMTGRPIEFYHRYLTYYDFLTQQVYGQRILANANNNENNVQSDSAGSAVSEKAADSSAKEHLVAENETKSIGAKDVKETENTEEAEYAQGIDASEDLFEDLTFLYDWSDDDFCVVDKEK